MKPDDGKPEELPEGEGPSPQELREAEALARSLGGDPTALPPADVSAAAALLRYSRTQALSAERAQALRADLSRTIRQPRRRRMRWWWLLPPLAAGATAAVLLSPRLSPSPPPPAPSAALLAAQAAAAHGDTGALDSLDRYMRAYRQSMFHQARRGNR